jgi:hypothetical protein
MILSVMLSLYEGHIEFCAYSNRPFPDNTPMNLPHPRIPKQHTEETKG